jgi:hypothetical protein
MGNNNFTDHINPNFDVGDEKLVVTNRKLSNMVQASIVYPRYKSLEINEAIEVFEYKCNNEGSCKGKFADAVKQVSKSTKLEAKGVREVSAIIIQELENVPTS